jgi:hypothetical protein
MLYALVQRIDGEGTPSEAMPMVSLQARQAAWDWREDQEAAFEI